MLLASWTTVSLARADEAALQARLEALGALTESETDLGAAARAAIARAAGDHARGDEASRARAERIADATISLIERRRARADAATRLEAARRDAEAMQQRVRDARAAASSDASERARLAPPTGGP